MFEQDYIMRQIKECVAVAMKLLFGLEAETPASMEFQNKEKQGLSDKLIREIDDGNIKNAISDMYLNTLDKTKDDLILGLMVYTHLCEKDDDFLDLNSTSISEIKESAKEFFSQFGLSSVSDLILF
ncbi:MAG: hypothetical protein IJP18_05285 [Oscillospiraceae bacterium]|nr:hypothetical protein [Oscillospiraceae bacterium]